MHLLKFNNKRLSSVKITQRVVERMLLEEGYEQALNCLRKNIHHTGFSASPEKHVNYYSVWARDHCITALAAFLTEDKELVHIAKKGIKLLMRNQLDNGQVPSYIEIESKKKIYGGLGRITSTDSNLWLIIALAFMYKETGDAWIVSETNVPRYLRFFSLLASFDSNNCGLIELHIAGDWSDIFNRSYHVLYGEVLYYQALKSLSFLMRELIKRESVKGIMKKVVERRLRSIRKKMALAKRSINHLFWFTPESIELVEEEYMIETSIPKHTYNYYQSHLMPFHNTWAHRIDVLGNILAIMTRIANKKKSKKIIKHILEHKVNEPLPVACLYPVVKERDRDWLPIYAKKERPHTYHNGGVWPFISGFWIYTLAKNNFKKQARKDFVSLAKYLAEHNWNFPEHVNADDLHSLGRRQQAWSAAGYIIAYHALFSRCRLF